MAQDLGKIEVSVGADKQSHIEASKEAANVTGGMGDVIRGFSRGGMFGGAQAGARVAGLAKMAVGIGLAVAGFMLLKATINKVISVIKNWHKEIESTVRGFAHLNATMALAAAKMNISKLLRDLTSADILSKPMARVAGGGETIKDAFRPLQNILSLLKTLAVGIIQPAIHALLQMINEAIAKIGEGVQIVRGLVYTLIELLSLYYKISTLGLMNDVWRQWEMMVKLHLNPLIEDVGNAINKIVEELRNTNSLSEADTVNKYMGNVGVALSRDKWNPWKLPAGGKP